MEIRIAPPSQAQRPGAILNERHPYREEDYRKTAARYLKTWLIFDGLR